MDPLIGGLLSGGASLLGGALNNFMGGQNAQQANAQNLGNSFLQAQWNVASQQQNQNWMAEMSNTAYQRGVADMKKAGLNPALMFGSGGPAGTPSSSPAQMSIPAQIVKPSSDIVSPAVSSAMQAASALESLKKVEADRVLVGAGTAETAARTAAILAEIPGKQKSALLADAQIQASRAAAESSSAVARLNRSQAAAHETYGVVDPGNPKSFVGGAIADIKRNMPEKWKGAVSTLADKVSAAMPDFSQHSPTAKSLSEKNPEYRNNRVGRPPQAGDMSWAQ